MAGLETIPAIVRPMTERVAMAVTLVENIQRADLNALEEATALNRLVTEAHLTHEQVAGAVGRSRASISNLLRLLELDAEVQAMLREGSLTAGHARALHSLGAGEQLALARRVVAESLSVRQTEAAVQALQAGLEDTADEGLADATGEAGESARDTPAERARQWRPLADRLGKSLGLPVRFQPAAGGGDEGRMVIAYRSGAELDRAAGALWAEERRLIRVLPVAGKTYSASRRSPSRGEAVLRLPINIGGGLSSRQI